MSGEHAELAPSAAPRWMLCPASRRMEATVPEDAESDEPREGTAAHEVMAARLELGFLMPIGETLTNGITVTHDMQVGAEIMASRVNAVGRPVSGGVERKILCRSVHEACWGTPDVWAWTGTELHVWDYKFGHLFVEVFENWQLLVYLMGIIDQLGGLKPDTPIHLHVVQPRSFTAEGAVRTWSLTGIQVSKYWNQLHDGAKLAMSPDAPFIPSPKACRDCRARFKCPALQAEALTTIEYAAARLPHDLTPGEIGRELTVLAHAKKLLEARITGLEAQAESHLRSGAFIPGWGMKPGQSRLTWHDPKGALDMGRLLGVDLAKPEEPITPTQALELVDRSVIFTYASRPPAAMKLAPDNLTELQKVFSR